MVCVSWMNEQQENSLNFIFHTGQEEYLSYWNISNLLITSSSFLWFRIKSSGHSDFFLYLLPHSLLSLPPTFLEMPKFSSSIFLVLLKNALPPPFFFLFKVSVCVFNHSVMSDSFRPYGLQPARLLCPWDSSWQEYWSGLPCPSPFFKCSWLAMLCYFQVYGKVIQLHLFRYSFFRFLSLIDCSEMLSVVPCATR